MSEKLKPCPFCGYDFMADADKPTRTRGGDLYCPNCGMIGPTQPEAWGDTGEDIADNSDNLWNRRADCSSCATLRADVERLRGEMAAWKSDFETLARASGGILEVRRKDESLAEARRMVEALCSLWRLEFPCELCPAESPDCGRTDSPELCVTAIRAWVLSEARKEGAP